MQGRLVDEKAKRRKAVTMVEVEACFRMEEEDESALEKKSTKGNNIRARSPCPVEF